MMLSAETISWDQLLDPAADLGEFPSELPGFSVEAGFQARVAWWMAKLSHLSYATAAQGRLSMLANVGLEERYFCQTGAIQCSLYFSAETFPSSEPVALLVFQGTDSLRQWISNIDTVPVAWDPCGYVHGGFAKALASVWDELGPRLEAIRVPLFLGGHSLGGALATLTAARLDTGIGGTYTFGMPRVGNEEFTQKCLDGVPLYRIVNHLDLVCSLPRPVSVSSRLRYAHAGQLINFDKKGDLTERADSDAVKEPSIRRLLKDAFQSQKSRPPRALADHAVQLYVENLCRLVL